MLALGATAIAVTIPFYSGVRVTAETAGATGTTTQPTIESGHATLVETNGLGVLRVLAIPIALSAFALAAAGTHLAGTVCGVCASLALGFCLATGFSVGLFYVPSALVLSAATVLHIFRVTAKA
jgi:hypothetical protein